MKTCFMLYLLISLVAGLDKRYPQRSSMLRQFQDLLDDEEYEADLIRRNDQYDEEQYLELRASAGSTTTNTGPVITLQNGAAMNTRLRVLYIDSAGTPSIAETGRLWVGQTKSITLPVDAKNVKILVEKDIFFEHWRLAYNGTLTTGNHCIRIVGVTLISRIHPCK